MSFVHLLTATTLVQMESGGKFQVFCTFTSMNSIPRSRGNSHRQYSRIMYHDSGLVFKWTCTFSFLFFSVLVFFPLQAQFLQPSIYFEKISGAADVIPSDLYKIYQDSRGFLWISSVNAVFRYDGKNTVKFPGVTNEGRKIRDEFIVQIMEDKTGQIWAVGDGGALLFLDPSTGQFKKYTFVIADKKITDDFIKLDIDADRQLYVLHKRLGLCFLNPEQKEIIPVTIPDLNLSTCHLLKTGPKPGQVILCTNAKLYILQKKKGSQEFTLKRTILLPYSGKSIAITTDRFGQIWLGGLYPDILKIDPQKATIRSFVYTREKVGIDPSARNRINTLCFRPDGKLWAGTNLGGLVILDTVTSIVTTLQHDPGMPGSISHNTITDILQDRSGVMWLTTWGNGLNKFVPSKMNFGAVRMVPDKPGFLQSMQVSCFYESDTSSVWIATTNILHKRENSSGSITAYKIPESIRKGNVCQIYAVLRSPVNHNELWLGTTEGLIIFDMGNKNFRKWKSLSQGDRDVEHAMIYFLDQDENGRIHAVTYSPYRLFLYDEAKNQFIPDPVIDAMTGAKNTIAIIDRQHNFWLSTGDNDVYKYPLREKKLNKINYTFSKSNPVYFDLGNVYTDPKNRIWLGSRQGLFLFSPDSRQLYTIQRLTESDGLPDKLILGIVPDQQGNLWISTSNGLCRLDPERLTFRNYTMADGLVDHEFSYGAFYQSPFRERLFFGANKGCNIFIPANVRDDQTPPVTIITQIQVYKNNEALTKFFATGKDKSPGNLIFRHDEKVIYFSFAGLHFADPEKNVYSYRLKGFNDAWSAPASGNTVTYTNLAPGTYQFDVKASNKDMVWSETPASISFRVFPPWYKTWWAYMLYVSVISGLLYYWFLLRMAGQKQMLETRRMEELDRLKTRLYANITHEFRTPLTVILGVADQLQKEAGHAGTEKIDLIRRNGQGLLDLINQMLELARLESGGQLTRYVFGDIVSFIEYSLESFQTLALSKQVALHFIASQRPVNMDYDPEKLLRIIANLVSNAIKFTPAGGTVTVYLDKCARSEKEGKTENAQFIIEVHDTGIGIPENQIPRVFDRFFQVDESNTRKYEGSGIGLALTKELVQILDGDIQVKSELGKGSIFRVSLPITQNSQSVVNSSGLPVVKPEYNTSTAFLENDAHVGHHQEVPLLLIIEDNPDLREFVKSFLSGDFRLDFAENGAIGVEKALDQIPDIIVSDVMMPEMDGFEVLDILKNDRKTSHIPIIMLTARAAVEDRLSGLKKGADAYMAKPFLAEELQIQIRNLLLSRKKLQEKYSGVSADSGFDEGQEEEDVFLLEIKSFLEQDLSNADLSMEEMSGALHMSRMQLHRKIKALTGLSASIYVRNFRLQKAKHLVETTHEQIAAIAYQVGFNDPKYFSRVYQEYFGFSPSDQRKIKS